MRHPNTAYTLIELPAMRKRAFTLIELLVVVTIIVVLLALLTPALDKAMESALRAKCGAHLHGWGVALRMYASDNKSHFPDNSLGVHTNWCGPPALKFFADYLVEYQVQGVNEPLDCPTQTYVRAAREAGNYTNLVGYYYLPARTPGANGNTMTYNPQKSNPGGIAWVTKRKFGQFAAAPIVMDMQQSISQDGNNHTWIDSANGQAMSSHVAGREDRSPDGWNFLFESGEVPWFPTEQLDIGATVATFYTWYKIPGVESRQ